MSRGLIVRPLAEADLEDAARWYEDERAGLAERFFSDVDRTFVRIRERPFQFPTVAGEVRRALLHTFPYAAYFRVSDQAVVWVRVACMPFRGETTSMIEIFSGLFISGVGVIHDLLRTYADLNTWTEQDIKVDGDWLPLVVEKGVLPPDDYTWSSEDKIPTRELRGTHEVVIAYNPDKKIKYRIKQGESQFLTRRLAARA